MRKQNPVQDAAFPRWLTYGLVVILVVFFGIGLKMVFAAFENPSCDPTTDPGACNLDKPIFVNTTTPDTAQVLQTPLTIGSSTTARQFSLFGKLVLSKGSENIQTVSGYNGIPINVSSADDHAIYGTANANGKYALYGVGASTASGVFASTVNGNALYASVTGTGTGLLIDASGKQALTITGNSNFTGTSTFTGDVTVTGSLAVGSITVGGQALTGNDKILYKTISEDSTLPLILKSELNWGANQYALTSLSILYSEKVSAGQTTTWKPFPTDKATYQECNATTFDSTLSLTNPLASKKANVRVKATYSTTDLVACEGDATAPDLTFAAATSSTPTVSSFYPHHFNENVPGDFTWGTSVITVEANDDQSNITNISVTVPSGTLTWNDGGSSHSCADSTHCSCLFSAINATCELNWATPSTTGLKTVTATALSGGPLATKAADIRIDYQDPSFLFVDISKPASNVVAPWTTTPWPGNQPLNSIYGLDLYASENNNTSGINPSEVAIYICSTTPCTKSNGTRLTSYGTSPLQNYAHPAGGTYWRLEFNTFDFDNNGTIDRGDSSSGTYYLTAYIQDWAGHESPPSITKTITITHPTPSPCGTGIYAADENPCDRFANLPMTYNPPASRPKTSCCNRSATVKAKCYDPTTQICCHSNVVEEGQGVCGGGGGL